MNRKQKKALKNIEDVFTDEQIETMKSESEENIRQITEVVAKTSLHKRKPKTLVAFEKGVNKDLKELGIVNNAIKGEIMTKLQKTQIFRSLVENEIDDKEVIGVLKDAMVAEKEIVVDKVVEHYPDHKVRLQAALETARLKGVDTKIDEETGNAKNYQVNIINPEIYYD